MCLCFITCATMHVFMCCCACQYIAGDIIIIGMHGAFCNILTLSIIIYMPLTMQPLMAHQSATVGMAMLSIYRSHN